MNIFDYTPELQSQGFAFQGDLAIVPVASNSFSRDKEIFPKDGRLQLLAGEATGHHHSIAVLEPAIDTLEKAFNSDRVPTAKLYKDAIAASYICEEPDLWIGFLEVSGAPFLVSHEKAGIPTEEHDAIRLSVGTYYIGCQRELNSASIAKVAD